MGSPPYAFSKEHLKSQRLFPLNIPLPSSAQHLSCVLPSPPCNTEQLSVLQRGHKGCVKTPSWLQPFGIRGICLYQRANTPRFSLFHLLPREKLHMLLRS